MIFIDRGTRDAKLRNVTHSRDARERYSSLRPPAIRFERTIARLSLSPLSFFLSPSTPYSFSRTLVYSPSLSTRFPPSSLSLFVLKFSSPPSLFRPSRFKFNSFFLSSYPSIFLFFFSLLSRCRNERVPRNSSMGFKTSTSRCPRKARTEEERATDASNGLRVRPFTNSTADPRTHTHARARWRKGRNRERERDRGRELESGLSRRKGDRERARARAREQRKRERCNDQKGEIGGWGRERGLERKKQVRRTSRDRRNGGLFRRYRRHLSRGIDRRLRNAIIDGT